MSLQRYEPIVATAAAASGVALWGMEMHAERGAQKLCIYIDKDGGATVGDCSEAAQQIQAALKVEGLMHDQLHLEVATPGVDRKLYTEVQMKAYQGQPVTVRCHTPVLERRQHEGVLLDVNSEHLILEAEGSEAAVELPRQTIDWVRVKPTV